MILPALVLAGCLGGPESTPPSVSTSLPGTTTTATTIPVRGGEIPVCATDDPQFVLDGPAGSVGSPQSDAGLLTGIDWFATSECARIQISFSSGEGAPAVEPPETAAVMVRRLGVLRISLGSTVTDSAIFDQVLDLPQVKAAYVVRDQTGAIFVDIHLDSPAEVRLTGSSSPAVLNIDLRPAGDPYPSTPLAGGEVVVLEPTTGQVGTPVVVTGYTRPNALIDFALEFESGEQATTSLQSASETRMWNTFAVFLNTTATGPADLLVDGVPLSRLTVGG